MTKVARISGTAVWSSLLAIALLWPGRVLSTFDGMPLNRPGEALIVGLAIPALWWLHRGFLGAWLARSAIATLLLVKVTGLLLAQQGLCARFATAHPFGGVIQTIPIDEPEGVLRSWDVRADWRAASPRCTAIVDHAYRSAAEFPSWFVNLIDFVRPGRRDVTLELVGHVGTDRPGLLAIETGEDMDVSGHIGPHVVASRAGATIESNLAAGVHAVALHARLTGERWKLIPRWNGTDAWTRLQWTTRAPSAIDALGGLLGSAATALVAVIVIGWSVSAWFALRPPRAVTLWTTGAAIGLAFLATQPRYERVAGAILLASAAVPVSVGLRNLRGAFLLIGLPWLTFFAARTLAHIGRLTAYSADDWLTYQVAGYRIFMNGYWLEGGTKTFDYQPLYRWLSGALHLVFGESSVGEAYWDAACLLAGALLAFQLTRGMAGFRAGMIAAGATLATFTLGTIWHFVGRGLSEITASGFAFLAAFFLLRARLGRQPSAIAAGVLATLMFYSRLNHLFFAASLLALLMSLRTGPSVRTVLRRIGAVRVRAAGLYTGTFVTGLALFAARTWWYTGAFSVFAGTSLENNDTGLRLATIASPEVWRRVGHSLSALVWMNEPPHPDPRALVVVAGVVVGLLGLFRVPRFRQLPASLGVVSLGAMASAFFVHTHNYPGRMTVHLVPFAAAAAVSAGRAVVASRSWRATPAASAAAERVRVSS